MYIAHKFTTEAAWLEWRLHTIMASEMPSLLGFNSMESGNQLIIKKKEALKQLKEGNLPTPIGNFNTRRGKILETAVLEALKQDFDMDVVPTVGRVVYENEETGIASTLDALSGLSPVEVKTSDIRKFNKYWRTGTPPLKYLIQLYSQMLTVDAYPGYLGGLSIREVPAARVTEAFPDYGGIYPSVDVSAALYVLWGSPRLTTIFKQYHELGVENLQSDAMWRMPGDVKKIVEEELRANTEFLGVKEGIPWVEDEWKKYGYIEKEPLPFKFKEETVNG
jgi:hypothetical protein